MVGDDPAALAAHTLDRELTGSDRDAARRGFNDALQAARLTTIDDDAMADGLSAGSELTFALPGADRAALAIETVRELLPGVTTFSGRLAGDDTSDFTLSIEDGKLVGSIRQGTRAWLVEPHTSSDRHVIRLIDRTRLPKDEPAVEPPPRKAISEAPRGADQPGTTPVVTSTGNVRVLFLHANNVTNANAQAANIVTAFNNSLSLSAVAANNYLTIAGVQQVAANFNGQSRAAIIGAMAARTAPFENINNAMASTAADIAFLLVQEDPTVMGDVSGFGRVGGVAYNLDQNNPFALSTDDYALGDLTALHEIGHVFGGNHENFASGIARPVVSADDTWMTLMGGYHDCLFTGLPPTCVRLGRWSNPDQTHQGVPLGVAGQRDMESHLETSMPAVSAWRAEPPPPPAAPNPLVKQPEFCYGAFSMSWGAQPSTTEYQLHRSTSSAFSNPFMIFSGASTSTFIDVTSGTWYLRARACNAGGCSGWTNQVSATRLGTCH